MKHLFSCILLLIISLSLPAQDVTLKNLKSKAENANGFRSQDQVILLDSTAVSVAATGSGVFSIYNAILINNLKGALANRFIRFDYDPLTAFAEFEYAVIHKADGKKVSLDIAKTKDYAAPASSIYWGARQIMLEVGKLECGDILEYKINKKGFTYALLYGNDDDDRFIPPMRGQFYDIVPFWCKVPTLRKVYRVSLPMEKEIQFQFYQGEAASSMRYENGRKVYTFAVNDIVPFGKEPNMVSLFNVAPKLMISTTPHWTDKSLWFYNINEDYGSFDAYGPAQKKVDELIKGKKTEMEKIITLTHWVADNIRYAGISMGKGEGFTLHNTKMNYTDRCGVCKDIAGSLISFLRMAGIKAFPAMTMAGSRIESIPADHFNHCVVVVKLSDGTYMPIDPTWVPFTRELWSSAAQQQNYLPGIPEKSDLLITPLSAPENHYFRIKADNKLDKKGNLKGVLTVTAEGQSDRNVRSVFTKGWQTDWKNNIENQLLAVSTKAKVTGIDWGKNPKDYMAAPVKISIKYEIPDYAIVTNEEILLKPVTMGNIYGNVRSYNRINTSSPVKKYDFQDGCSRLVELDETITLPKNFSLSNPKNDDVKSSAADFNGYIRQNDNKVEIHQQLTLKKRIYEAREWEGFRNALILHKSYGEYLIINK